MNILDEVEATYDPAKPLSDEMLLDPPPWRLIKAKYFYATPGSVFPISAQVPKGQVTGNLDGVTFLISEDYFKKNPLGNGTADYMVRHLLAPFVEPRGSVTRETEH